MASAYLKILQDLKEAKCTFCAGLGRHRGSNPHIKCEDCFGTGLKVMPHTVTHHHIREVIQKLLSYGHPEQVQPQTEAYEQLEHLVDSARYQAIAYTYTQACQWYDQGLNPKDMKMFHLIKAAINELNPPHDKEDR